MALSPDWRRRYWRCRRGMQELDILLSRYLDQLQPGATPQELDIFDRLLALQDPELQRYLLAGEAPGDGELAELTRLIRRLPPS